MMAAGAWALLFIAGLMETGWAIGLKYTEGWTRVWPSVGTIVLMAGSFYLLSKSLEELPVGTAYAVWTGIGAVGTVIIGMFVLGESRDTLRVLCLLLIVAGIVGLKCVTPE
jgi:quaternary ammonium compound-resistance protein SugE